jgi:hypothetical protein
MTVSAPNTLLRDENLNVARYSEMQNLATDEGQTNSAQSFGATKFDSNAAFKGVKDFFKNLVVPDAYLGKLCILANKTWQFIKSDRDIIVATVCLVATSFFINPAIPLIILELTSKFTTGFAIGLTLTHFFSEKIKPLIDRLKSTNTLLQAAAITICSALCAPVGMFIAGFTIGNKAHGQLNK